MKRFVAVLLSSFLLTVTAIGVANARWVTKEVKWQISNQGGPLSTTGIWIRDTTHTAIGPVDTTAEFSLDEACPIPRGVVAPGITEQGAVATTAFAAMNDTTVIGWLLLQSDSTAAPTAGIIALTAMIDGKVGGYGTNTTLARGWVKADSALVNGAAGGTMITGDESVGIPIRSISPYGNVRRWGTLRARISATGTALGAARVFVRYWKCGCE